MRTCPSSSRAFTRIELFAVLAASSLLVAVVFAPALASNKSDSERLVCFNNLRLIGRAVQMWAGDHNGNPPWRTLLSDGGTLPNSGAKAGLAWFEYFFLSNELVTPKILACPSDTEVKRAAAFNPVSMDSSFFIRRGTALSYVVGLHAIGDVSRGWLSSDRNIRPDPGFTGCSARVSDAKSLAPAPWSVLAWTNGLSHGEFGHVLLMDGSVEYTSTGRLREILLSPNTTDNDPTHFLPAR